MNAAKEIISILARLILAGVFLWAAVPKVWDPADFARATAAYDILPIWAVNTFSMVLAWLELFVGSLLLVGLWTRASAVWAAWLMALFTGLMIYLGFTGASHDCGCFPGMESQVGFRDALRDFLIMLPALWLIWRPGRWLALDALRGPAHRAD